VDISKWREDIQEPAASSLDSMFKPNFTTPIGLDSFELKDTVSEHSMDSAYQSQTGRSQRGTTGADGNQWMSEYDFSAMNNQFPGNSLTSPLESDNSTPFLEHRTFNQVHHADGLDASWNADTSAEQVLFSSYSNANANHNGSHMNTYGMNYPSWGTSADASLLPFTSYDTQQEATTSMFDMQALSQAQPSTSVISAPTLPALVHRSSSFVAAHDPRRASTQSAAMTAYVASPPSMAHAQLQQDVDFHQQTHTEPR
jgi:hypothetical protein